MEQWVIAGAVLLHVGLIGGALLARRYTSSGWPEAPENASELIEKGKMALGLGKREDYYSWSDTLGEGQLGEAEFHGCCIIPKRGLVDTVVSAGRECGASSVYSIGSGPALLEWLLLEHLEVACVDDFYDTTAD